VVIHFVKYVLLSNIKRALENKPQCPVCRASIFYSTNKFPINFVLNDLINTKYPEKIKSRIAKIYGSSSSENQVDQEMRFPVIYHKIILASPKSKNTIFLDNNQSKASLKVAASNERKIAILENPGSDKGILASIDLISPNTTNSPYITLKGENRIKINSISDASILEGENHTIHFPICKAIIMNDYIERDPDKFAELKSMVLNIESLLTERLNELSFQARALIRHSFGDIPKIINSENPEIFGKSVELFSLVLLDILLYGDMQKRQMLFTQNSFERLRSIESRLRFENVYSIFRTGPDVKVDSFKDFLKMILFLILILIAAYFFHKSRN